MFSFSSWPSCCCTSSLLSKLETFVCPEFSLCGPGLSHAILLPAADAPKGKEAMIALEQCRLIPAGLFLTVILGAIVPAMAQQRPAGVLRSDPGYLINTPFQADWISTYIYADGTEKPDLLYSSRIVRNSGGCVRADKLEVWPHWPSPQEVQRFNTAVVGSPEEQSPRGQTTFQNGAGIYYYWMNYDPVIVLRPWRGFECRAPGPPDFSYCDAFQIMKDKQLPDGYVAKDLGTKSIEGVSAHGLLISGPESSQESWCSDELGSMMLIVDYDKRWKSGDGRIGSKQELKHLTRTEPDASLFKFPETHATGNLRGVPFQAEWIHTLTGPDGTERPDPGTRGDRKVARSGAGCVRTDELAVPWNSPNLPSTLEFQRFRAARMGSFEEQALTVEITINDRIQSFWWVTTERIPRSPDPGWECYPKYPLSYAYCSGEEPANKKLPPGFSAEDLGTKTINGITAQGMRVASAENMEETWCSNELGSMVLLITQSKRRDGWYTSKWELKDITRTEPDPALFKFPKAGKGELPVQGTAAQS